MSLKDDVRNMKKGNGYCRVKLEPELEERAALWNPAKRRAVARKMQRWARQLIISAFVLERDAQSSPQQRLKVLPLQKARLN